MSALKAIAFRIRTEPAILTTAVVAALLLFGVTDEVAEVIGGNVESVVGVVDTILIMSGVFAVRQSVTPVAKTEG